MIEQNEKPIMMQKEVTSIEKMEEEMFLGLRKNAGVSIDRFNHRYSQSIQKVYAVKRYMGYCFRGFELRRKMGTKWR